MSDNWLLLVPADPTFQPAEAAANAACDMFRSFVPQAEDVSIRFSENIIFFDPGANFERVSCPRCKSEVTDWWADAMDVAAASDFSDLLATTPCCQTKISLDELSYEAPAAFGRFALSALNPNIAELAELQRVELSSQLGCGLHVVWQRI